MWGRDLYIFVPAYCEKQICTYFFRRPVRESLVHIYTSLRLEGDLYCTYLYQLTVRERFVNICTSLRWERDLNCTYWYQLTVRERLFIFVPAYCKREICTYWYVPAAGEREREICTVHTCTSFLWGRDLYVFAAASCEKRFLLYIPVPTYWKGEICTYLYRPLIEIEICTYLYQLTVRGRFVR